MKTASCPELSSSPLPRRSFLSRHSAAKADGIGGSTLNSLAMVKWVYTLISSPTRIIEFFDSSPCIPPPVRLELCRAVAVRPRPVGGAFPTRNHMINNLHHGTRRSLALILSVVGVLAFGSATFAQNVSVSGSTGADGSYATLKAAFDALNANTTQT